MLTLNEKRFATLYLHTLQNSEDGTISSNVWSEYLTPKRQSLGLTIRDSTKVTNLVDKYGTDDLHPIIQAYEENGCKGSLLDYDLSLTIGAESESDTINQELLDKIHEYENYAKQLLEDTKKIEKKTQQLSKEVYDVLNPVANAAANTLRKTNPNAFMIAGGVLALAALGNWLYEKHQKNQLLEQYQRKMRLLQEEKRKEAKLKIPTIIKRRKDIRAIFIEKIDNYIQKDFETCISDEKELQSKYVMFKRFFSMKMRLEYLDAKLKYIEDEYNAWIEGRITACNCFPLLAQVVDNEILKWFQTKLDRNILSNIVNGDTKELALPYVLLISEPYLLRRHLGFYRWKGNTEAIDKYFQVENYAKPIFNISQISSLQTTNNMFVNIIIQSNYYKEMKYLYSVPDRVTEKGIGFWDIVIAIILYSVMIFVTRCSLFILPILILCFWRKKLAKIFPLYYRDKWYFEEIERLEKKSLRKLYSSNIYNTV